MVHRCSYGGNRPLFIFKFGLEFFWPFYRYHRKISTFAERSGVFHLAGMRDFERIFTMNLIEANKKKIDALCLKHKVKRLFVFGSVLTDRFSSKSDVDFLVDFDKSQIEDYFDNFFELKYGLESALRRDVDLVESQAIKNRYFQQSVEDTKQLIYG